MYDRKRRDYKKHLHELEVQQNIGYRPMIWSTWGRSHPETQLILLSLAKHAARRRGLRDHHLLLRRTYANIGVQLMKRAVRMLHACMPNFSEIEERLLFDNSEEAPPHSENRIVTLANGEACCRML